MENTLNKKTLNASNKDDIVIYMDVGSTLNQEVVKDFGLH